ncbi:MULTISPECIES: PH domain-containing protein [Liquorilactobacillus]|uniref:YokE-like PH domain-containing protein n=3 Tax=Liquorilactobacillus TaxID=2767888 RepID=A0A3S6QSH5_9LACO|nr:MULTISPECIES: PH domain-containing protein [Liquorilactobacillus]AUJ31082.1 hypothetical protein BSQ49_12700 [Liquorilactobacillus hordei]AUJ33371.1 hypothetical protein BSQ50_12115 [Liquorilactobacillus nagelii]MCP9329808.1 PH domain-containing protein [Liquorilactobacillus satsumensis]MDC7954033.1 PH domain-containing protein [Liquorilactobacillus mali]
MDKQEKLKNIKAQFKAANVTDTIGTRKEIKALPDLLADDEIINYATTGIVDNNTVLVVCTDSRVLFVDKGMLYGIKSSEIPLDMINGVAYSTGLGLKSIFETGFKRHSELRLPSTAQINH